MSRKPIGSRIIDFPLTKIIIGLVVCGGVVVIGQLGSTELLNLTTLPKEIKKLFIGIIVALLSIVSYNYLFKFYEKRKISELSKKGLAKNLTLGVFIGVVLQSLTILVIYLAGGYTVVSVNPVFSLLLPLTIAFTSAIFEEIIFRGILFRIIEEKLGSYISLFISAFIFGLLHLANPNSSFIAAIGLAIQAGLLLGAAYIFSRNLWFPIAIHFAWNFTETGIFGAIISGNKVSHSLLTSEISGTEWISGGKFGPEGSIQATLFCLILTVVLLVLSHKKGNIAKPFWSR